MKTERIYLVLSSDYLGGLLTDLYASSNYKNLREIKKIVHTDYFWMPKSTLLS